MGNVALLWATATGLNIVLLNQMTWWHPACNFLDDGSVDFGYGFPLPDWTPVIARVTSAGFLVMPHIFVLNIVILALIAYPIYRLLIQRLVDWKAGIGTLFLIAGLVFCLIGLAPIFLLRSEFYPVRSIAAGPPHSESYFSFRPAFLAAWLGKQACPA